jgi:hypothetical protein
MTRQMIAPRGRRPAVTLVVLAAVAVLVAACGSGAGRALGPQVGAPVDEGRAFPGASAGPAMPESAPGDKGQDGNVVYDVAQPDLLIIKTGTLSLQVTGLDEALAAASAKVAALGGYVSGSSRKGDGDDQIATATYRIPAAQWDAALVALRAVADKVLAEQTDTQDVTGDVLDLGARITNLKATEAALQAIMARATKISDVLAVQEQLTQVRGEIEQLSTQKKHLEEQAAFSTLTVEYSLKPQAAVVTSSKQFDPNSEIDKAAASLVAVLQALATAGIWFAIVWLPILLVFGIVGLIVVLIARRIRRNRPGRATVLPTPTEG